MNIFVTICLGISGFIYLYTFHRPHLLHVIINGWGRSTTYGLKNKNLTSLTLVVLEIFNGNRLFNSACCKRVTDHLKLSYYSSFFGCNDLFEITNQVQIHLDGDHTHTPFNATSVTQWWVLTPHFSSDPSWDYIHERPGVPCMYIYCSPGKKNCSEPPLFWGLGLTTPLTATHPGRNLSRAPGKPSLEETLHLNSHLSIDYQMNAYVNGQR